MMRMTIGLLQVALLATVANGAQESPSTRGCAETLRSQVRFPLLGARDGVDGELQLLTAPPCNAAVRIVDRQGRTVDERMLERPQAQMEKAQLYGDERLTYLVTVDYSIGMGSYNGPITFLMEVAGGKMKWLQAVDRTTGKRHEIGLMRSLKTVWEFVDARGGKGKDILHAACRPDWKATEDPEFTITYTRHHFDGKEWITLDRTVKGYADFDAEFPDVKLFP